MKKLELSYAKKAEYIYFAFFFAGIIMTNIVGYEQLEKHGVLNIYFIKQLLYSSINYNDFLGYVTKERGTVFFLLLLMGMTRVGIPIHYLYIAWNGFAFGAAMVSVISNFGFKGILLLGMLLFPQYLFYVPLYLMLFAFTFYWKEISVERQNTSIKIKNIFMAGAFGMIVVSFFIMGILTESYVNPQILRKIWMNF